MLVMLRVVAQGLCRPLGGASAALTKAREATGPSRRCWGRASRCASTRASRPWRATRRPWSASACAPRARAWPARMCEENPSDASANFSCARQPHPSSPCANRPPVRRSAEGVGRAERGAARTERVEGAQVGPYFDLNRKALQEDVMDIEDLTKLATALGEREGPCPYFLAKSMAQVRAACHCGVARGGAACGWPAQLAYARCKST